MTGGILQVTLLLIAVASGNAIRGLFEHDGRNAIPCRKTEEQLNVENDFVIDKGPR